MGTVISALYLLPSLLFPKIIRILKEKLECKESASFQTERIAREKVRGKRRKKS